MPEINSIPYANAEDLHKYMYDNYYSTEQLELTATLTGYLTPNIFTLLHETGVTEKSICMTNYDINDFNPLYGERAWKFRLKTMNDCFVFIGFKETTGEPSYDMVESHTGFMLYDGKLYASVGNGTDQQKVEIIGIDLTRFQNYKIIYNRFYIEPLPLRENYLGIPSILTTFPRIKREYKLMTTLTNYPPINMNHHLIQFIKNSTNENQFIELKRFIYKEVYAD